MNEHASLNILGDTPEVKANVGRSTRAARSSARPMRRRSAARESPSLHTSPPPGGAGADGAAGQAAARAGAGAARPGPGTRRGGVF